MTNRYAARFESLRKQNRKAFIPFTLVGWPDPDYSFEIMKSMIDSGAAALELGWAFSDPMADGKVIQAAAFETLAMGFKVSDALDLIKQVRKLDDEIPIGLLVYYNMVLALGADDFFCCAAEAGIDGVLVVDLPPESAGELTPFATKYGIDLIFMVSPLTSDERLQLIVRQAGGFIYAVSRLGITGTDGRYDAHLQETINKVHQVSGLPVCVGFGVSSPQQAKSIIALGADGVITGSRVLELVDANRLKPATENLAPYFQSMVQAVSGS